jgi:hypothetical protein
MPRKMKLFSSHHDFAINEKLTCAQFWCESNEVYDAAIMLPTVQMLQQAVYETRVRADSEPALVHWKVVQVVNRSDCCDPADDIEPADLLIAG